jgi:hypothetical protein
MRRLICGFLLCSSAFGAIVRTSVTGECQIFEVFRPPAPSEPQLLQSIASPYCDGLVDPSETFAQGIIEPDRFGVGLNAVFRGGEYQGKEVLVSGYADLVVSMSIELVVTGGVGAGELFGFTHFSHGHGGSPLFLAAMERSTNWFLCPALCGFSVPFVFGEPLELTVDARLRIEANQVTYGGYGFSWGADIQMIRDAEGRPVEGRIMEAGGAGGGGQDDPAVVPEPSVVLLSGLGLLALAWGKIRSRTASQ